MFTTGQLTKKIGIETNTTIRWLREGILIPLPTEGRNNLFPFEEILIGRAVAPLHTEWNLRAELIAQIAAFLRELLSVRQELGYKDYKAFHRDIVIWRQCAALRMVLSSQKDASHDYMDGIVIKCQDEAKKAGVKLPDGWHDENFQVPVFPKEKLERVKQYQRFMDLLINLDDWHLFISRNSEGIWRFELNTPNSFKCSDTVSYIAVDLAKAFADLANEGEASD